MKRDRARKKMKGDKVKRETDERCTEMQKRNVNLNEDGKDDLTD